jgi:hypothetical protein
MNEEIKTKIDDVFGLSFADEVPMGVRAKPNNEFTSGMKIIRDTNVISTTLERTEALKLAYKFAINQIEGRIWHKLERRDQLEALRDMFDLADMNLSYIQTGKVEIPA